MVKYKWVSIFYYKKYYSEKKNYLNLELCHISKEIFLFFRQKKNTKIKNKKKMLQSSPYMWKEPIVITLFLSINEFLVSELINFRKNRKFLILFPFL